MLLVAEAEGMNTDGFFNSRMKLKLLGLTWEVNTTSSQDTTLSDSTALKKEVSSCEDSDGLLSCFVLSSLQ
jgi:hypothetical protein